MKVGSLSSAFFARPYVVAAMKVFRLSTQVAYVRCGVVVPEEGDGLGTDRARRRPPPPVLGDSERHRNRRVWALSMRRGSDRVQSSVFGVEAAFAPCVLRRPLARPQLPL